MHTISKNTLQQLLLHVPYVVRLICSDNFPFLHWTHPTSFKLAHTMDLRIPLPAKVQRLPITLEPAAALPFL